MYVQELEPVADSPGLSALVATLPVVIVLVLLGGVRMKAHRAGLIGLLRHRSSPSPKSPPSSPPRTTSPRNSPTSARPWRAPPPWTSSPPRASRSGGNVLTLPLVSTGGTLVLLAGLCTAVVLRAHARVAVEEWAATVRESGP